LETIRTENVILATGGLSYPATGSTGDGYKLAHTLGHRIVRVRPSLVPLETETSTGDDLDGLFLKNVNLTLFIDGEAAASEFGEVDFFDRGIIGGALVLRVSRDAVDALIGGRQVSLSLDLKPALTPEQITERIGRELADLEENATVRELLRKLMPAKLILPVSKRAGIRPADPARSLNTEARASIAGVLKDYRLKVKNYRPFEEAIVTAGGVDVAQVDSATMQSTLIRGLYFAGEVLDIDANTGGYNLQLAFSSGRLAGMLKK
jgi:predicted Rossmann fold flavoprotein